MSYIEELEIANTDKAEKIILSFPDVRLIKECDKEYEFRQEGVVFVARLLNCGVWEIFPKKNHFCSIKIDREQVVFDSWITPAGWPYMPKALRILTAKAFAFEPWFHVAYDTFYPAWGYLRAIDQCAREEEDY